MNQKQLRILGIVAIIAIVVVIAMVAIPREQPVVEEPVVEEPVVEEPVVEEEPKEEEPVAEEQADGRIDPPANVEPNMANDPLQARVDAGELPPLNERLPKNPLLVGVREAIGTHGGEIVTWYEGATAPHLKMWLTDPLVRWKEDYSGYEPGLAESFEWSEDGRTIKYTLREGLRWSDGNPFTSEDIRFWWEDLATFPDSGFLPPWWSFNADGTPMEVNIINETQFSFTFKEPNWIQPTIIAQGFWEWEAMKFPKHYVSQFHPKYNPEFTDFVKLREKINWIINPEFPTLNAWVTVQYDPGVRIVLERNPFYWKLDPQGNQLPYIDRIVALRVDEEEVRILRALAGEWDLSFRGIDSRNIPTLLRNQERGNYNVVMLSEGAGAMHAVVVNQDFVGDDYIRELLRNTRFRRAVSVAIDREVINEAIWGGMGTVQQGTISRESPHFAMPEGQALFEEWQQSYSQWDPDLAKQMLDEIGLTERDANGFRLRPDGSPLTLVIDMAGHHVPVAELIRRDLAVVGLNVELRNIAIPEASVRFNSSEWMFNMMGTSELDLWTYPDWVFPVRGNRAWPLQGRWFETGGAEGEQPLEGSPAQILQDLYRKGLTLPTEAERHEIVHEAVRFLLEEGPFFIGTLGGFVSPVLARPELRNVPHFGVLGPWAPASPSNLNITTIFWER